MPYSPEDQPIDKYPIDADGLMRRIEDEYGVTIEALIKGKSASLLKDLEPIDSFKSTVYVGTQLVIAQDLIALIVTNDSRHRQVFAVLRLRDDKDVKLESTVSYAVAEVGFGEHEPVRVDDPRNELSYSHNRFHMRSEGGALIVEPRSVYVGIEVLTKPKDGSSTEQKKLRGEGSLARTKKSRENVNQNIGHLPNHYKIWLVPEILDRIVVKEPEVVTKEPKDTLF